MVQGCSATLSFDDRDVFAGTIALPTFNHAPVANGHAYLLDPACSLCDPCAHSLSRMNRRAAKRISLRGQGLAAWLTAALAMLISSAAVVRAAGPLAASQPVTSISATSAVLNGMAVPNGQPALAWFEWGQN